MTTSPEALREAVRALEAEMARPGNMFAYDIAIALSALQEAREALGPFAGVGEHYNAPPRHPLLALKDEDGAGVVGITVGHYRRAAEVYRALSPGGADE